MSSFLVRYQGVWQMITPKPYEPERMTTDIAWIQIKEGVSSREAYRLWFERQRRISHLFQQCGGKSSPSLPSG